MNIAKILLPPPRKVYRFLSNRCKYGFLHDDKGQGTQFYNYVDLYDQEANDYIKENLSLGKPCMISKFGTVELSSLVMYKIFKEPKHTFREVEEYITNKIPTFNWLDEGNFSWLCRNAGFFPDNIDLLPKFYSINLEAIKQIDILGSYQRNERYFDKELSNAKRVNLDGYYAPFYWKNPWTKVLEGKKVLVIHPFAEDIEYQYKNSRTLIWKDKDVLPEFKLITYKSVQSMLGIKTPYKTWFEALNKMEDDISKIDFDIALIGCGAYGMPLSAFVKSMGKQAIHLAGWTQVLFGIIGERWINNPKVFPMLNKYWTHPSKNNVPREARKIENGAYW